MKQLLNRLFVTGLLVFTQAWADTPNYDTNSGIVSFPRVTVNDKDRYINVDLLLNPNGTWKILDYEPEPLLNLTGEWTGTVYGLYSPDWTPMDLCAPVHTGLSLTQNGSVLTGEVYVIGYLYCPIPKGLLTGQVIGNKVTFTVETPNYGNTSFSGHIANGNRLLVGVGSYGPTANKGDWVIFLTNNADNYTAPTYYEIGRNK